MCFIHGYILYIHCLNKVSTLFSLNVLYCIISFSDQNISPLSVIGINISLINLLYFYLLLEGHWANSNQLVHKTFF